MNGALAALYKRQNVSVAARVAEVLVPTLLYNNNLMLDCYMADKEVPARLPVAHPRGLMFDSDMNNIIGGLLLLLWHTRLLFKIKILLPQTFFDIIRSYLSKIIFQLKKEAGISRSSFHMYIVLEFPKVVLKYSAIIFHNFRLHNIKTIYEIFS